MVPYGRQNAYHRVIEMITSVQLTLDFAIYGVSFKMRQKSGIKSEFLEVPIIKYLERNATVGDVKENSET